MFYFIPGDDRTAKHPCNLIPQEIKYHKSCDAKNCDSTDAMENIRFFRFPSDKETKEKWMKLLKVPTLSQRKKYLNACGHHFDEEIWKHKLKLPRGVLPNEVIDGDYD